MLATCQTLSLPSKSLGTVVFETKRKNIHDQESPFFHKCYLSSVFLSRPQKLTCWTGTSHCVPFAFSEPIPPLDLIPFPSIPSRIFSLSISPGSSVFSDLLAPSLGRTNVLSHCPLYNLLALNLHSYPHPPPTT